MFGALRVGDHVRLRRDVDEWFGPRHRKGKRGIVRSISGVFSVTVEVELVSGGRIRVPASALRRTGGHGERGHRLAVDLRRGAQLALLIVSLPALFSLARYLLAGGEPSALILPTLDALATGALDVLFGPFGWLVVMVVAAYWLRRRLSR